MTDRRLSEPKAKKQIEMKNDVENVDADSKRCLVERNKSSRETQIHENVLGKVHLTSSDRKGNKGGRERNNDEFWRIASDILQGEQLLHRLQMVQQRQEADMQTCQEEHEKEHGKFLTEDLVTREGNNSGEDEKEEIRLHTINSDKTNPLENEITEEKESGKTQEVIPTQPEHDITTKAADHSDENPSVSVCKEWIPINSAETICNATSFRSSCHRLSVTETSTERRIHEDAQGKQNLQRAAGILNLADDPDVLEIPFNTNIMFELLPTKICPGQDNDCLVSKQKMLDEVNRENQRGLGTTRQREVQKGFREGNTHQLKERKLLFEAFQQDTTQGPTRLRKPLTTSITNQVCPTVLERTRSLDMFSTLERKKSLENLHSTMPSGGSRDKTRLSPYPKQDKNVRLYRSSDSISSEPTTQITESSSSVGLDKVQLEAPLFKQNPFFKLRPALALKPEVEKEIREAEAREDELRRQRRTIYGDKRQSSQEVDKASHTLTVIPGAKQELRGKLERVWPPPSNKEHLKSEQTKGPSVHKAGSQRSHLWQRWEFGQINGQHSAEKD
ncbi:uncharacterized protein LOC130904460 [Corythoichthys intestinalis]|uniref:uncharacterized protein LOC130904460 n=1 Tax=Corythoichthys intestinalis TaxID=161448 RepID=UPI0025A569BA|nr:uncharacterized protein LOC130904460 [Corythoichthys intestinalis]